MKVLLIISAIIWAIAGLVRELEKRRVFNVCDELPPYSYRYSHGFSAFLLAASWFVYKFSEITELGYILLAFGVFHTIFATVVRIAECERHRNECSYIFYLEHVKKRKFNLSN